MNDLFNRFEFICSYMDDLLILTRGYWKDHIQDMELNLNKLKKMDLNVIMKSNYLYKPIWNI